MEQKCINYGDKKLNLHIKSISEAAVKSFVNALDIGEIHTVPGYCEAFRPVTALTNMMIDIHLRCAPLREKLIWFNDLKTISSLNFRMMVYRNQRIKHCA